MITEMNIRAGGKIAPDFMLKLDDRDITQNFSHRLISWIFYWMIPTGC